jgi:hypothetical protein
MRLNFVIKGKSIMSASFKHIKLTQFAGQKGCDISIVHKGEESTFNVWCDTLEPAHSTIRVTHNNDIELLVVTVDKADFTLPTITYSDDELYCYLTFSHHCVHIQLDDEAILFDVRDLTDGKDDPIDSVYFRYNE